MKRRVLIAILILLPAIVRIANYDLTRLHGDEAILGYFSAHYQPLKQGFLSPIPIKAHEWICQWPPTFFLLQKMYFFFAGHNILSLKLSVIPYVLIVSLMLYLITKRLFDEKAAVVALIVSAFLPISVYLETMAIHNISSTAIFLIFFYSLLNLYQKPSARLAIFTGISCSLCYLFYLSSFIALPVLLLTLFFLFFKTRPKKRWLKTSVICILTLVTVLGPFLIWAYQNDNFYFTQRFEDISLTSETDPITSITKHGKNVFKSLYQNDIGGAGGYLFNKQAFLEPLSLSLFLVGLLLISGFILIKRQFVFFLIPLIISTSFISMVISSPPPAYQRAALSFPFIALVISIPFYFLFQIKRLGKTLPVVLTTLILLTFIFRSQRYFNKAIEPERNNPDVLIIDYIKKHFPHRRMYIAFYPTFHLEKVFYFTAKKEISADYHFNCLKNFNPNEKYVYIIGLPSEFNSKFAAKDPQGNIIHFSDQYSIFAN